MSNPSAKPDTETRTAPLETRIAQLEAHLTEQDAEIYRLSRRVDALVKVAQDQKAQLVALAETGSGGADAVPADEKPPHY